MLIDKAVEKLREARAYGMDWDTTERAMDKVTEELNEVREAFLENDPDHLEEELGDLIFTAIDISRYLQVDPSKALEVALNKFSSRFGIYKRIIEEQGLNPKALSFDQRLYVWKQAKKVA